MNITIEEILRKTKLGWEYVSDEENILFEMYKYLAQNLCDIVNAKFVFIKDKGQTAGVIYDYKLIFMSSGMFVSLCKLADLIIKSGLYTNTKQELKYYNLDFTEKPYEYTYPYFLQNSNEDDDKLFHFTLKILIEFIVLHEIGHLINNHGTRTQQRDNLIFSVDTKNNIRLSKEDSINSQAREIIADNYASFTLMALLGAKLHNLNGDHLDDAVKKYITSDSVFLYFFLTTIYLYFKMTNNEFSKDNIFNSSHPPPPFRINTILTNIINKMSSFFNDDTDHLTGIAQKSISKGDDIYLMVSDRDEKESYFIKITDLEYLKL